MLSKASKFCEPPPVNPLQVQTAHGNVDAAVLPEHELAPPPSLPVVKMMGGPLPTHLAGGGPTTTPGTQLPATHPCPAGQTLPHEPQFLESLFVLTQLRLQAVRPPTQLPVHVLEMQTWFTAQTVLHPPQWSGSPAVGMH